MSAERRLAAAVILRAVEDLRDLRSRNPERRADAEDARAFLAGGADLEFWCSVAGIDPVTVREVAA